MSWRRSQYQETHRTVRHFHRSLCIAQCVDCHAQLQVTHVVARFGGRCRRCWDAFRRGAETMASHYANERS
jgi:recombinational DNA repair protein (RecF pathway)